MGRRSPLLAVACVPGPIACLAAAGLSVALPDLAARPAVQWLPWLVGLPLVGIPHGALDHRLTTGRDVGAIRPAAVAGYAGLAALVFAAWWLAPAAALAIFLAVAAYHFGQGDLYWSRALRGGLGDDGRLAAAGPRWRSALFLVVRGVVPVALPALASSAAFADAAGALSGRLLGGSASWSMPEGVRLAGIGVIAALVAAELAALAAEVVRGPARRAAAWEVAETAVLVTLFAIAPPILAMGVYFHAWHSLRHVGRLLPSAEPTRRRASQRRWASAAGRFLLAAAPATLAALVSLAALAWTLRGRMARTGDLGLAAIALIAALTAPHVLVVLRMDRAQGVWTPATEGIR